MRVLHIDKNHPILLEKLTQAGFENTLAYTQTKEEILEQIEQYDGLIIRSRFSIDAAFLKNASNLKFIGRVGAGLENIDQPMTKTMGIKLFSAPLGNSNAVGEHALGMLLSLFNKLNRADQSVRNKNWLREEHRGIELEGKTIGIIGYGNMGKSFAKKLYGFDIKKVVFYDILPLQSDKYASSVSLEELQSTADVLSLHTPQTKLTKGMINHKFIMQMKRNFWLINTARGSAVSTKDLVDGLKSGKILGAGLDVLEYESSSFENIFESQKDNASFSYLLNSNKVLLSPHVAGLTMESHIKLSQIISNKIIADFGNKIT